MLLFSLLALVGVALAIPAPRQLIVHSPRSHEAFSSRGTNWDGVLRESGDEVGEAQRLQFEKRANDLIGLMMERRSDLRDTNGPSSQDPYGTGRISDEEVVVTLREAKPATGIQALGLPVRGGDPVSKPNPDADNDVIWTRHARSSARVASIGLPAHERRLVEERDPSTRHIARASLAKDHYSTRQEEAAEAFSRNGQNKNWKKSTGRYWLKMPGNDERRRQNRDAGENTKSRDWIRLTRRGNDERRQDDQKNRRGQDWSKTSASDETSQKRRQERSAGEIDWTSQASGIEAVEDETGSVRMKRKLPRAAS